MKIRSIIAVTSSEERNVLLFAESVSKNSAAFVSTSPILNKIRTKRVLSGDLIGSVECAKEQLRETPTILIKDAIGRLLNSGMSHAVLGPIRTQEELDYLSVWCQTRCIELKLVIIGDPFPLFEHDPDSFGTMMADHLTNPGDAAGHPAFSYLGV